MWHIIIWIMFFLVTPFFSSVIFHSVSHQSTGTHHLSSSWKLGAHRCNWAFLTYTESEPWFIFSASYLSFCCAGLYWLLESLGKTVALCWTTNLLWGQQDPYIAQSVSGFLTHAWRHVVDETSESILLTKAL